MEIVVIGNGAPHFAAAFRTHFDVKFPVFTDPDLRLFHALGLKRGLGGMFNAAMWKRGFEAFSNGYRQGATKGDAMQLGGALGVRPNGQIWFFHASEYAGDHPSWSAIVQALR